MVIETGASSRPQRAPPPAATGQRPPLPAASHRTVLPTAARSLPAANGAAVRGGLGSKNVKSGSVAAAANGGKWKGGVDSTAASVDAGAEAGRRGGGGDTVRDGSVGGTQPWITDDSLKLGKEVSNQTGW